MNKINYYSNAATSNNDDDFKFGNRSSNNNYYGGGSHDPEELKKIQQKIDYVENESLESTQRALRTLTETTQIGTETATELVRQGEKLKNMDRQLDDINDNLNATQKHINNIKSVFGGIKNRFFSKFSSTSTTDTASTKELPKSKTTNSIASSTAPPQPKAEFIRITNSAREQQLEENLDAISSGLSNLTSLAKEMSYELERQDPLLDRLNKKTTNLDSRVAQQNTQMKKILK